jgi:hypothetical protein
MIFLIVFVTLLPIILSNKFIVAVNTNSVQQFYEFSTDKNVYNIRGGVNKINDDSAESKNAKKKVKNGVNDAKLDTKDNVVEAISEVDEDDDGKFEENERGVQVANYAKDIISKTPPMTQIYLFSSVFFTILSCAFNKNNWPTILDFDFKSIIFGLQIWRIFTPFLFIGKLDIYYPLTLQFIWQHMSQLEKLNYNKPEEFLVMLSFGGLALISIYTILGISTKFLGHNLGTYLVYIWARVFEGMDVNFMDILTLKAEMLPWFFCAQSLILDGQIPFADLIGILAGHLYYYLNGKKILVAPSFLKKWFNSEKVKSKYSKFKDDFE